MYSHMRLFGAITASGGEPRCGYRIEIICTKDITSKADLFEETGPTKSIGGLVWIVAPFLLDFLTHSECLHVKNMRELSVFGLLIWI